MPAASTAETWTNTSLPPSSGAIKPKPLVELKNFTVPMVITNVLLSSGSGSAQCVTGRGNKNICICRKVSVRPARSTRVRKTEELRLTGTQEPRAHNIGAQARVCNGHAGTIPRSSRKHLLLFVISRPHHYIVVTHRRPAACG